MLLATMPGGAAIALISYNGLRVTSAVTFSDVFLIVASVLAVLAVLLVPGMLPRLPRWLVAGAAGLVLSIVLAEVFAPASLPRSLSDASTEGRVSNAVFGVRFLVAIAVAPVVLALFCTSWKRVRILVALWILGTALSCLVAALAAFTPLDLQPGPLLGQQYTSAPEDLGTARYIGVSGHPNHLAVAASLASPVAMALMRERAWYIPVVALLGLAILLSGSRAALVRLAVTYVAVLWIRPQVRFRLIARAVVTALAGLRRSTSPNYQPSSASRSAAAQATSLAVV
jgi:hypothetical protein